MAPVSSHSIAFAPEKLENGIFAKPLQDQGSPDIWSSSRRAEMTLANPDGKKFPDYRRTHQAENTSERGMLRPGRSGESRVSSFRNSMPSA